jgi:SPP1 gp7 family putative phage head morphogenesis protein
VREVAVTGDATRLTAIRDTRLRRIAEGMIPPSGDTLTGILVNNLNQELTKTLRVVKQGLINGQSYVKQAQALKETFNGNAYNALRVVRTEGNRLANAGTYLNSEDLKEAGVSIRRQWVATLDGRTRDSHQALDGQYEDDEGLFHIHGLSARYPGDFGDPAEDIQCRCTTIDVVQGLEPTLRRGVNPVTGKSDIASYRDYGKWKKQGLR